MALTVEKLKHDPVMQDYLENISSMLGVMIELDNGSGRIFSNVQGAQSRQYPILSTSLRLIDNATVGINIYHKDGDQKAMAEAERLIKMKLEDYGEVVTLTEELLANYDKLNIYRSLAEQVLQTTDRAVSFRLLLEAVETLVKAGRCGVLARNPGAGKGMRAAALREAGKEIAGGVYAIAGTSFEKVAAELTSYSLFPAAAETLPALNGGEPLVFKGAYIVAPLLYRRPGAAPEVAGFLFAADPAEESFTSAHQHAVSTIASLASITMQHFDQMETTRRATSEMDTMMTELMATFTDLQRQSALIEQVNRISARINSTLDMAQIFNSIADYTRNLLEAGQAVVAVAAGPKRIAFPGIAGFDRGNMPNSKMIAPETILGHTFTANRAVIENEYDAARRDLGCAPPFSVRNLITYPIESKGAVTAVIVAFNRDEGLPFTDQDSEALKSLAYQATTAMENARLLNDLKQTQYTMMVKLSELAEKRDPETGEHLLRMQKYSRLIAQQLAKTEKYKGIIDEKFINELYAAAPLHDIGKVAIGDSVLLKRGRLTPEEFEVMKTHASVGEMILKGPAYLKTASQIAGYHHEKWDGSGYPHRVKGEEIPLAARIVAVADVYDALTSRRVYKEEMSHEYAMEIIEGDSGKHFDRDCVEALKANIREVLTIKNLIR